MENKKNNKGLSYKIGYACGMILVGCVMTLVVIGTIVLAVGLLRYIF